MADFCLHPDDAAKFLAAIRSGEIAPEKLVDMTSADRHAFLSQYVGEENAGPVNALLESKLLLKNQQQGLVTWAKTVGGLKPAARRDIVSRIQKLDRVLNPDEEKSFLADLAAQKLGGQVTPEEAQNISQLAAEAARLREAPDIATNPESWTAYGSAVRDLEMYADSLKPGGGGFGYWAAQILNIPRTSLTSILHFSAPFVQGRAMVTDPMWFKAFGEQFKYFADEKNYEQLMGYIRGHPDFDVARAAKLGLTDLTDKLSQREEALQSSLLQRGNEYLKAKYGVPNVIGASSRAFTGFLNFLRFQSFTRLAASARAAGEDVSVGSQAAADIADAVNNFTGRGDVMGWFDRHPIVSSMANATFFAPRKFLGMIQRLNPQKYVDPRISGTARAFSTRQMIGYAGVISTVAGLIKIAHHSGAGVDVGLDPNKSDFLQVTIGKSHFDLTEGEASLFRLLSRLGTGHYVTKAGKDMQINYDYNAPSRASLVMDFLRNKLAPVPGAIADALVGKDSAGNPVTLGSETKRMFMPITVQEFYDWAKTSPKDYWTLAPALLVPFGLHMQSDVPRELGLGGGKIEDELGRLNFSYNQVHAHTGSGKFDGEVDAILGPMIEQRVGAFIAAPGYRQGSDAWRGVALQSLLSGLKRSALAQAGAKDPEAMKAYRLHNQQQTNPRKAALMQELTGGGSE